MKFNFFFVLSKFSKTVKKIKKFLLYELDIFNSAWKVFLVFIISIVPLTLITLYISSRTPTFIFAQFAVSGIQFTLVDSMSVADLKIEEIGFTGDLLKITILSNNEKSIHEEEMLTVLSKDDFFPQVLMSFGHATSSTTNFMDFFKYNIPEKISVHIDSSLIEKDISLEIDSNKEIALEQNILIGKSELDLQVIDGIVDNTFRNNYNKKINLEKDKRALVHWVGKNFRFNMAPFGQSKINIINKAMSVNNISFVEDYELDGEHIPNTTIHKGSYIKYLQLIPERVQKITAENFVTFHKNDIFHIDKLEFDPLTGLIHVGFIGRVTEKFSIFPVGSIKIKHKDALKKDYRLTWWDVTLNRNPFLSMLINISLWLLTVIVGSFALIKIGFATNYENK